MSERLKQLIEKECRLEGDFLLRSGQRSDHYFDKYLFETNPTLLNECCLTILGDIDYIFDYFAGLEMGGIPIATILSHLSDKPTLFVRKEAKNYGTKKLTEGPPFDGMTLLVVEDVVTTGGQVIESVNELRNRGAIINNVVCVILRNEEGRKNIESNGLTLYNLFDFT